MFDLEQKIREWIRGLSEHESIRKCDAEEMQQHLRDSIDTLLSKGLSEEEAFLIAAKRVGTPDEVGQEFGKAGGYSTWTRRALRQAAVPASLLLINVFGLIAIAWVFEGQMSDLRREVGPLRAAQEGRFAIDQDVFPYGNSRLYDTVDRHKSVSSFVSEYESTWLSDFVSEGSYGKEWLLVNHRGNPLATHAEGNEGKSLQDAGIKPGDVLRVVKVENGRFTI